MEYKKGQKVLTKDELGRWVEGEIKFFDKSSNMDGSTFQSFRVQVPSGRTLARGGAEVKPIS